MTDSIADRSASRVFVLGAGFSAAEQFPLVRGLKSRVIHFLEAERHSSYRVALEPGAQGFSRGQFYAGLDEIDPDGSLEFEELLISLQKRLRAAQSEDPCFATDRILRIGCARLLWCIHNFICRLSEPYENFSRWLSIDSDRWGSAAISFNWDLLVEKCLADAKLPWGYSATGSGVPALKPHGSINWSTHLQHGLKADYPYWQPISVGSKFCFDARQPLANPDIQETNSDLRYLLFPGDPEFVQDNDDVKRIWAECAAAIQQREAIVFIGYSLPDYDSHAINFFRQFVGSKKIEVYNPSVEHLDNFRSLLGSNASLSEARFEHCPYAKPLENWPPLCGDDGPYRRC